MVIVERVIATYVKIGLLIVLHCCKVMSGYREDHAESCSEMLANTKLVLFDILAT